jgi:hypothetical protein
MQTAWLRAKLWIDRYPVTSFKGEDRMKTLIAVTMIVHGLIVAAQSASSFNPGGGVQNPAWLNWWPANLGQSWLLTSLGIERTLVARAGGLLWLVAGMALVGAGLGALGWVVPSAWWRGLALSGAAISLAMLAIYLHPFYGIGIGASIVLLTALLWERWPLLEQLGA